MFKQGIIQYETSSIIVPDKTAFKSYYNLNENGFDSIYDNNANTATGVSFTGNKYISFNGTGQALLPAFPTLTNYTISFWCKTNSGAGIGTPIGFKKNNHIRFWFDGNSYMYIRHYNGTTELNMPYLITSDIWYHFAATWNGTNIIYYVNGENVSNGNISGMLVAGASDYIGSFNTNEKFNGSLDDVAIFTRALTSTEISTICNNYKYKLSLSSLASDANLIAHYEFNDNVNDRKGTYTSTSVTNPTYNSNELGLFNDSAFFSGNTSSKIYNFISGITQSNVSKSVLCWVKPLNHINRQGIIGNKNTDGSGWSIGLDSTTGYLSFSNGPGGTGVTSTTSILKNVWTQVGFTLDNSNKLCKLFVNGQEIASNITTDFTGTSSNGVIGAEYINGTYPFIGYIDEIGIFNKRLSNAEVLDIYNHQLTGETLSTYFDFKIVSILSVAGGGGGGNTGSGGGAGGFLFKSIQINTGLTYTITVGGGGAGGVNTSDTATNGTNSTFSTLTSIGGGRGLSHGTSTVGISGGSGGGAPILTSGTSTGGTGTVGQGNNGGKGLISGGWSGTSGGGGGAGQAGSDGTSSAGGGKGGDGLPNPIAGSTIGQLSGSTYYLAGGGGGGEVNGSYAGAGGLGGGGNANANAAGLSGTANTGGGGGGGSYNAAYYYGGGGGSGIVIIKYITTDLPTMTGGTKTTNGNYTIHTYTTSGTLSKA